ncbi:hypothetical protein MTO96_015613 [Rhipicephalus appendiculatus]
MIAWHSHMSYDKERPGSGPRPKPSSSKSPWVYKGPSAPDSAAQAPGTMSPWVYKGSSAPGSATQSPGTSGAKVWCAMACCLLTIGIILVGLVVFVFDNDGSADTRLQNLAYSKHSCLPTDTHTELDTGPLLFLPHLPTGPSSTLPTNTGPPLLCSVSETATVASLYPDDKLCDITMYTHVRVENSRIVPVDDNDSYTTFTTVCSTVYSATSCGISFDAR